MRRMIVAVALVAAATGCGGLTEPQSQARLHGTWRLEQEPRAQHATYQFSMAFRADGTFALESRSFGEYGLAASDPSGYMITSGTYTAHDGTIRLRAQRQVTWDFFNGAGSPEIVEDLPPTEPMVDFGRFEIIHNMLIRRWTSYASDGPVPVTSVYFRVK